MFFNRKFCKTPEQIHNETMDRMIQLYFEERAAQERAREETRRIIELEREQMRQRKEQEKLYAEQSRQAEILRKHDSRIADLEDRMAQAESDIEHWSNAVASLYALLDIELAKQAGAMPGSKTDVQCQRQIITLNNKIHAAETKVNKAKSAKRKAERELSA